MTAAPTPPPHVPMVLVLAGMTARFSAECVEALARAGYDADWFGSYNAVESKISDAKANVDASMQPDGSCSASAREQFLAWSQSGHLSQDAIYTHGASRDNPCGNVAGDDPRRATAGSSPQPRGDGNVTGEAPCMPHPGESNTYGSPHQTITAAETRQGADIRAAGGTVVTPTQVAEGSQRTAQIAVGNAGNVVSPPLTTQQSQQLINQADQLDNQRLGTPLGGSKRADDGLVNHPDLSSTDPAKRQAAQQAIADNQAQSRSLRAQGASGLQQASAGELAGAQGLKPQTAEERAASLKKAVECIEEFRKQGQNAMRDDVVKNNSTNSLNNQLANAKASEAAAAQRASDARAEAARIQQRHNDLAAEAAQPSPPRTRSKAAINADMRTEGCRASDVNAANRAAQQAGEAHADATAQRQGLEQRLASTDPTDPQNCLRQQADRLEGYGSWGTTGTPPNQQYGPTAQIGPPANPNAPPTQYPPMSGTPPGGGGGAAASGGSTTSTAAPPATTTATPAATTAPAAPPATAPPSSGAPPTT